MTNAMCHGCSQMVRVDVHVIDHDGNLFGAAALAALASLVHFRRPHVDVIGDEVTIHTLTDHVPDPLSVLHRPVCVQFAVFGDNAIVVDPTRQEEQVAAGGITVAVNSQREVCALHKLGGAAVPATTLTECIAIATKKAAAISAVVEAAIKADAERRAGKVYQRGPSLREMKKIKTAAGAAEPTDIDIPPSNAAAAAAVLAPSAAPAKARVVGDGTAELFQGGAAGPGWSLSDESEQG